MGLLLCFPLGAVAAVFYQAAMDDYSSNNIDKELFKNILRKNNARGGK